MTREPDASRANTDPDRLRALVKATGMSQAKLAKRIGVGLRSVERWVSGEGEPPYPALYCIEVLAGSDDRHWKELREAAAPEPPLRVVQVKTPEPKRKPHPLAAKLGLNR